MLLKFGVDIQSNFAENQEASVHSYKEHANEITITKQTRITLHKSYHQILKQNIQYDHQVDILQVPSLKNQEACDPYTHVIYVLLKFGVDIRSQTKAKIREKSNMPKWVGIC